MEADWYLKYLVYNIHTTIIATVDDEGLPSTAAVDMMDTDGDSLYFLTARGKSLYDRLIKRKFLALTALKGEDTMSSLAISIQGQVREVPAYPVKKLFDKNPYMYEIYPKEEARKALTVFQIYRGKGERFDLSKKPIERVSFAFGGDREDQEGYFITRACTACRACLKVCPQSCIDTSDLPFVIKQENCLHCGACLDACPVGTIERRRG